MHPMGTREVQVMVCCYQGVTATSGVADRLILIVDVLTTGAEPRTLWAASLHEHSREHHAEHSNGARGTIRSYEDGGCTR